jgi:hypothetical protein
MCEGREPDRWDRRTSREFGATCRIVSFETQSGRPIGANVATLTEFSCVLRLSLFNSHCSTGDWLVVRGALPPASSFAIDEEGASPHTSRFPIDHSGPVSLCRPTKFLGVPGLKSGGSPRKNLPLSRPTPVRTADRPRFRARNAGRGVAGPEGAGVRFARLENCKFTCGSACRYTAARQVPRAMDGLPVEPCARRK